ncbi:hypothetical protein OH809_38825 [Streptomyces sp. NBC_00873]|nr:hypothetical protein OH809_38825 [Streptomyces sp. NBC_00873]WTA42050.1 hypothetical protein OH821_04865 [Streptomyces sp. NBC_00842]
MDVEAEKATGESVEVDAEPGPRVASVQAGFHGAAGGCFGEDKSAEVGIGVQGVRVPGDIVGQEPAVEATFLRETGQHTGESGQQFLGGGVLGDPADPAGPLQYGPLLRTRSHRGGERK